MSRGDLSEVEGRILRVLLPVERELGKRGRGRPPEDNRNVINGILWRVRSGAPWRDAPEKYGDESNRPKQVEEKNGRLNKLITDLSLQ